MAIRIERIRADIEAVARCTETPGDGATRPTFSRAWGDARAYVIAQAESAGCEVRTDAAGNVHARLKSFGWGTRAYLCGSHIDSVPHGGDYDGVAGVVVGLELLRSAAEDGFPAPVELITFAEEEGPTFGLGMLGSRAWVGELTAEKLAALKNAAGENYLEAGRAYGVNAAQLEMERIDPAKYLGLIEVHIEQGPGMWRRDQRLAVVRAIAGRASSPSPFTARRTTRGRPRWQIAATRYRAHASIIADMESLAIELADKSVITVGRIENHPNAINVIADRTTFTIDFRAPFDATLKLGGERIRDLIDSRCRSRRQRYEFQETEAVPGWPLDLTLASRARQAAGQDVPITTSGALHDSIILAPHLPTIMLFVPSRDGISHNPAEFSRVEDIALAASVVERVVRRPTLTQVNGTSREAFVAAFGGIFEHSPWIAERGWAARPFASMDDVHEKLCAVVKRATPQEQLGLIQAHPDLVGRLAREGRLTRESTAEQAAAGLTCISPDEIAAFERYNAAYRDRFGFPFVICARENKKDAILAAMPRRLENSRDAEIATALNEIYKIARLRFADAVWED